MKISPQLETQLYITAFIIVLFISVLIIFYLDGRTDEALRESDESEAMLQQAVTDRDYWQAKYQHLVSESDGITVLAAEAKFEREQEGHQ